MFEDLFPLVNFSPHETRKVTINDEQDCRSSFIAPVQHDLRNFYRKNAIVYRSCRILEKLEDGSRWCAGFSFSKTSSSTVRKFANKEWHDINGKLA